MQMVALGIYSRVFNCVRCVPRLYSLCVLVVCVLCAFVATSVLCAFTMAIGQQQMVQDLCILIRNVGPETSESSFQHWLDSLDDKMEPDWIHLGSPNTFMGFSNTESACSAVKIIHNQTFEGNQLDARLLPADMVKEVQPLFTDQPPDKPDQPSAINQVISLFSSLSTSEKTLALASLLPALESGVPDPKPPAAPQPGLRLPRPPHVVPPKPPAFPYGIPPGTPGSHHGWFPPTSVARLSCQFSGDGSKGDVKYALWRQEVVSLLASGIYSDVQVMMAIRRSLRGLASDVLLTLRPDATTTELLVAMDNKFGNVLPVSKLQEQFWSQKQSSTESITNWACRLEDLAARIQDQDSTLTTEGAAHMVQEKFVSGLHNQRIHDGLRHIVYSGASFNEILVQARILELETQKNVQVQQVASMETSDAKTLDKILSMVSTFDARLKAMEDKQKRWGKGRGKFQPQGQTNGTNGGQSNPSLPIPSPVNTSAIPAPALRQPSQLRFPNPAAPIFRPRQPTQPFRGACYGCGNIGHRRAECPLSLNFQ